MLRSTQLFQYRRDDINFLAPHVPAFAGVWIQARNQNSRLCNPEFLLHVRVQDAQRGFEIALR